MSVLPMPEQRSTTDPLIADFEEDQKNTVFFALSGYLQQNIFCDVTLIVGQQVMRAHKMVLAPSSKFFSNAFNHYPSLTTIDLERELAPHGISVTFDDVRIIVLLLYCVGTVEISPQKVESLLLIAQIMGIPSLIRLLKRCKESVLNDESQTTMRASLSPLKKALAYVQDTRQVQETRSLTFEQHSTTSFFHTRKVLQPQRDHILATVQQQAPTTSNNTIEGQQQGHEMSPPSRSGSRATLASLSSFPFNPISSPALREANEATNHPQILDGLDPSFFNQLTNLQSNQIDDLENALLPHLHNNDHQETSNNTNSSLQFNRKNKGNNNAGNGNHLNDLVVVEESFNTTMEENSAAAATATTSGNIRQSLDIPKQELLPLISNYNSKEQQHDVEMPKCCSTPKRTNLNLTLSNDNDDFNIDSPGPPYETMNMEQLDQLLPNDNSLASPELPTEQNSVGANNAGTSKDNITTEEHNQSSSNDLIIDEDALVEQHEENNALPADASEDNTDDNEFKIPLNASEAKEGKSITFNLPGSSKSLTLNFSADALNKMRQSFISKQSGPTSSNAAAEDVTETEVTSSTQNVRKKSVFSCQLCSKFFPSKRMLTKHEKYHVEKTASCKQCNFVFNQKWKLEQHIAKEHAVGQTLECKECGKQFQWHRNLLAHINLNHQREIRYRCKNCPLTFLKKKAFIYHHREKHREAVEPWCTLCLEVFDGTKQREDHLCSKIENTGRVTICHKHDPPLEFHHQDDLLEHLKTHHGGDDNAGINHLQKSCPVCHKKFLLRKNLMTHMKRFHETEGKLAKYQCQHCEKTFYYKSEKEAHENTHTGTKQFKCEICEKAYSSKKALYDHNKIIHAENKVTYSCEICGKVLRDKYKLKYHMMVHSEKRNFKCSHCSVEFKGGENLRAHVLKFHKESTAK